MELTTALRWMRSFLLLVILTTQFETSALGSPTPCQSINSRLIPMTDEQVQLCEQYPELVLLLVTDAVKVFKSQCHRQFKHERWDCTNVFFPIFGATQSPFLSLQTKEAAFVYALTSATVLHTVAATCAKFSDRLNYCGCDSGLKGANLTTGETWGGCSPDMNFSINFTKQFLDAREIDATLQHRTFVLHNSHVGRLAVTDYMPKTCTCTSSRGRNLCSQNKTCAMGLPTMDEVAALLKRKWEQSIYSMITPSLTHQHALVVERKNHKRVDPSNMIYFSLSPDYCTANPDYNIAGVAGRACTLSNTSVSHHCDNLCCDHGYETYNVTNVEKPCQCKFVWCCHVECATCNYTETRHRCKEELELEPEVSSTSISDTDAITITNTTLINSD